VPSRTPPNARLRPIRRRYDRPHGEEPAQPRPLARARDHQRDDAQVRGRRSAVETTLAQLRERIANVAGWLEGVGADAYAGASERKISTGWMRGKAMTAPDYLSQFAVPNFFFHLVTAYSILRHNGVDLGKMDYIGGATLVDF